MKIVSKFRDYYDSVQKFGHDDSTVFVRDLIEIDLGKKYSRDTKPQIITEFSNAFPRVVINRINTNSRYFLDYSNFYINKTKLEKIQIVFCGKVYNCLYCPLEESFGKSDHYFYSTDDIISFYKKHFSKEYKKKKKVKEYIKDLDMYFSLNGSDVKNLEFFIRHKITIGVRYFERNVIVINDCLEDLQFYRVVDPFSAFQQIDMWTSGVLASPPNFMIEIEDKYRIESHGFDPVYGFRKRPSNKQS